jgi:hypothetical protein
LFKKEQGQKVTELRVVLILSEQGLITGQGLLKISVLMIFLGLRKKVHNILRDCGKRVGELACHLGVVKQLKNGTDSASHE